MTLSAEVLQKVGGLDDAGFTETTPGPMGMSLPVGDYLDIVAVDWWMHEQDVRRATGRPGHVDGPAAEHACERLCEWVAAKLDSTEEEVSLVVTGSSGAERRIGRAAAPLRLHLVLEDFVALAGGRAAPEAVLASGRVELEGDPAEARRVMEAMAVTP